MKRSAKTSFGRLSALLTGAILLATGVATAQEDQGMPGLGRLDTVQVTSQKRVESIQDVPIAITAFDAEDLIERRIRSVDDLADHTPGLFSSQSPIDVGGTRLNIRGIGNADPQIGLDSKTALYFDGIYVGKASGTGYDLPNIERVEVLRGPQGTLYGRNAVAGAINVISKQADPDMFSAEAKVEAGNYNYNAFEGSVNMPLSDTVAVQLGGRLNSRDGWVDNTGQGEDYFGFDNTSLRADVTWAPTDFLSINYAYTFIDNELGTPYWQTALRPGEAPGIFSAAVPAPVDRRLETGSSPIPIRTSSIELDAHTVTADWNYAPDHNLKLIAGLRNSDASSFQIAFPEYNAAVGDALLFSPNPALGGLSAVDFFGGGLEQVLNVAGSSLRPEYFAALRGNFPASAAGTPAFPSFVATPDEGDLSLDGHEQFSAELVATGSFSDRLDYTAGLYFFSEDTGTDNKAREDDLLPFAALFELSTADRNGDMLADYPTALGLLQQAGAFGCQTATPAAACAQILPALAENAELTKQSVLAARNPGSNRLRTNTDAYAIFGQMTYSVTEDFRITGGARLSFDEKEGNSQRFAPFLFDEQTLMGQPIEPLMASETFGSFDPALILEFDVTDNMMIYGKYTEAFRSGGFNEQAETIADFTFDKEEVTAFEGGFRAEWFDSRFRLNMNLYLHSLNNEQVVVLNPDNPFDRSIQNADSEYRGIEFDGAVAWGGGVTTEFAYTYAETDLDDVTNPFSNTTDKRTGVGVPENSLALSANYERQFQLGDLNARIGYTHKDETFVIDSQPRDEQSLVDASVAFTINRKQGPDITIAAWGQNLTDDEYRVNYVSTAALAYDVTYYGTPRTYGVSVSAKF